VLTSTYLCHRKLRRYAIFSSTDCISLGLDEYGTTEETFIFELTFFDTNDNKYSTKAEDGIVISKGEFLHKVKRLNRKKYL
jgi:hypothetical protein